MNATSSWHLTVSLFPLMLTGLAEEQLANMTCTGGLLTLHSKPSTRQQEALGRLIPVDMSWGGLVVAAALILGAIQCLYLLPLVCQQKL